MYLLLLHQSAQKSPSDLRVSQTDLGDLNWRKSCSSLDITVAFYRMKDCASVPIYSSPTARWFNLS